MNKLTAKGKIWRQFTAIEKINEKYVKYMSKIANKQREQLYVSVKNE